jgi:hypothetical protein
VPPHDLAKESCLPDARRTHEKNALARRTREEFREPRRESSHLVSHGHLVGGQLGGDTFENGALPLRGGALSFFLPLGLGALPGGWKLQIQGQNLQTCCCEPLDPDETCEVERSAAGESLADLDGDTFIEFVPGAG